jgi:hypothetical protein
MTAPTRTPREVLIADVPWPVHKLIALAVGLLVLVIVGASTASIGAAVVAAAASSAVVGLGLSLFQRSSD